MLNNLELLAEIKQALQKEFPGIIDKVILFGSQAKGNANENSDHDILVVVNTEYDWKFKEKVLEVLYDFDLKYEILTDVKIISLTELGTIKGKQPFILEAFEYGMTL